MRETRIILRWNEIRFTRYAVLGGFLIHRYGALGLTL